MPRLLTIPNNWQPRGYQHKLADAFCGSVLEGSSDLLRFYHIWHRRAGKDLTDINLTAAATATRPGLYWHVLPKYTQARKAVWDGKAGNGQPFLSAWPDEFIDNKNNQEMKLTFKNGSIWQVVGGDDVDRLVGSNPVGIVMSEYALTNPSTWNFLEPILLENGGWSIFNTTPRGENHAYTLWQIAIKSPQWFTSLLTVDDTGVITDEQIQRLRDEGTSEEIIQQEYYCSFKAAIQGAYFADSIRDAEAEGRLGRVPVDTHHPVHTFWDLGVSDYTTIWFVQFIGREIWLVDYYQAHGKGPDHYIHELDNRQYSYGTHHLPHDAANKQFTLSGKSIRHMFESMKPNWEWRVTKRTTNKNHDIAQARMIFNRCVFDDEKCHQGINALKSYTKKYDENKKMFLDSPLHDWASHGADAFLNMAVNYSEQHHLPKARPQNEWMPTMEDLLFNKPQNGPSRI